ncbi:MAG TPA: S24 family peptidase [Chitinophagales bacterium]|nr:S24 family peptidase [Chitinophagales bacterium]
MSDNEKRSEPQTGPHNGRLRKVLAWLRFKEVVKSDAQLEYVLGISQSMISRYRRGLDAAPEEHVLKLESVFKDALRDMPGDGGKGIDHPLKGNDKFLDFYRGLPAKQKEQLTWIPFYDVNFAAGITKLYRDGQEIPTFFAALPMFPEGRIAIKVRGDSMEGMIPDGSYAVCKDDILPTFEKDFSGGNVYALVFKNDDYIIKKVKSTKSKTVILTESVNKDYQPKEYNLSDVRFMYPYIGYVRMKRHI